MSFSSRFRSNLLGEWEEEVEASKTFDSELGFTYGKRLIVISMLLLCIKGILMLTGTNCDKFRGYFSQENQRGTYFGTQCPPRSWVKHCATNFRDLLFVATALRLFEHRLLFTLHTPELHMCWETFTIIGAS
ncbi:hypothetical protein N7519_001693 [Penicillium mononematosum]|uniref:uncharacterized protein n=1 Tax=Penicillium mononematosum TaxID=268346 RepID=UPI0025484B1B|nr:uncharacterized protein N7519_001693 [Penicillium mononematosum]KAJ6191672.1 hypothetical protein N7519_001693 [Penicillium mononematosum]